MTAIDKIGRLDSGPTNRHRREPVLGEATRSRSSERVASSDSVMPGLLLAAGMLGGVLLVLHYNSSALHRALGAVGGMGLAGLAAVNIAAVSLCAAAWRGLTAGKIGFSAFLWFRFARNAAADLLGFIPAAGELVALREMTLHGIEGHSAVGSLIADLTIQLIAQIAFTLVGVSLLLAIGPDGPLTYVSLIGAGLLIGILAALIAVQRCGIGRMLAALARRILPQAFRDDPRAVVELDARLRDIYGARRQIALSTTLHLSAWFVGIAEAGLALSLMGAWPGLKVILIVESIVFGLRTTAFFVPGAWGVQEAAYVMVGPVFGLGAEVMLALTLVKRARELVVGVPVLVFGQVLSAFRPRGRRRLVQE